jgi:hypothetical protein
MIEFWSVELEIVTVLPLAAKDIMRPTLLFCVVTYTKFRVMF